MEENTTQIISNQTRQMSLEEIRRKKMIEYCRSDFLPTASQIISNMNFLDMVYHLVLLLIATATIAVFIEQVFFLKDKMKQTSRRRLTVFQAGIPPLFALTSILGLFSPRGFVMIDFLTSVYFGYAIHFFLSLFVNYYGGEDQLILRFQRIDKQFMISTGPLCCFFRCIPQFNMTKKSFTILWYATFQAAFFRPLILLFQGIFDFDPSILVSKYVFISIMVASMLTGVWALVILRKASEGFLSQYRVIGKYLVFQFILLICNVQPFVVLAANRSCDAVYTLKGKAVALNYQIMIFEFFVMGLLTRFLYRRASDDENLETIEKPDLPGKTRTHNGSISEKTLLDESESVENSHHVVVSLEENSRSDVVV